MQATIAENNVDHAESVWGQYDGGVSISVVHGLSSRLPGLRLMGPDGAVKLYFGKDSPAAKNPEEENRVDSHEPFVVIKAAELGYVDESFIRRYAETLQISVNHLSNKRENLPRNTGNIPAGNWKGQKRRNHER